MMETTACLSPGPAVLLVMSQGLSRGVLASIWSSCGILAPNTLYFAVSATGIAAVLLESNSPFNVITWIGAAYTIWLGVRTFATSGGALSASAGPSASSARMFTNGFVLQISRPGLLLFFVAVLPQFILPGRSIARQVLILAVTSIFIEFVVLILYGFLAAQVGKLGVGLYASALDQCFEDHEEVALHYTADSFATARISLNQFPQVAALRTLKVSRRSKTTTIHSYLAG